MRSLWKFFLLLALVSFAPTTFVGCAGDPTASDAGADDAEEPDPGDVEGGEDGEEEESEG